MAKSAYPDKFYSGRYTLHVMRYTTATHLLEAGVPLAVIKHSWPCFHTNKRGFMLKFHSRPLTNIWENKAKMVSESRIEKESTVG